MKARCSNPKNTEYGRYGGRGIQVCKRWLEFINFLADMGERPKGMSLERNDNSKGYEPGNCRWATKSEQARNTRRTLWITYNGVTKCLKDWTDELGLSYHTVYRRLKVYSWPVEEAVR